MSYFSSVLDYLKQYPELIAILLGTLASWAGVTVLEYFIPEGWSSRRVKQVTMLTNIALGTVISFIAWAALDPKDPRLFNFSVSFTCALVSPFSYVWVAKALTHFFPWLGSVWAVSPPIVDPAPPPPASPAS